MTLSPRFSTFAALSKNAALLTAALLAGGLAGCTKAQPSPIVTSVRQETVAVRPGVNEKSTSVNVTLTVSKSALLGQEFLYGADLQYSSFYNADMDLYNQSLALGHIPATFRIAGDELQLVSDNRRLFPSDVNHPEQLLSRFKILAQNDDTLTLSGARSEIFLAQVFEGTHTDTHGGLSNAAGKPPRDSWIRSFEFDPNGNYLLQETSLVLDDGSIAEFMESIMPRATLAPGANFEKFEMDPANPVGGDDGAVARYRFLGGEKIFDGEKSLNFGQHFDLSPRADGTPATVDWYVTRNISDTDIEPVKEAVEGWNRYFTKFKGFGRDVVVFKGRLPEGKHLGDPRFNVINWDSRRVAGAAYESQASDPQSGKQSHSLIYMPAAWLQIGTDYWTNGQFGDEPATGRAAKGLGAKVACLRDLRDTAALAASGRLAKGEVEAFGAQLLKQTLFHEVGHALGLAHNFKGSLSFDRAAAQPMFSTSIMDYNDFEIERQAFTATTSSDGPSLEYDRQALSAIYDKAADVAATDAVVPACNDAEADNEDGGVDPLCIRYDIEKDPTLSVNTGLSRLTEETLAGDVTLAQALRRVPALVLTDEAVQAVKDADALKALAAKAAGSLRGSLQFYVLSGKASFSRAVRTNVKSLLAFADGVLPDGYDERAMRERAFAGVTRAVALKALPAAPVAAEADATKVVLARLGATPYVLGLAADAASAALDDARKTIAAKLDGFTSSAVNGLPKLRAAVFATLARHDAVPFFFGKLGDAKLDYETALVGLLSAAAIEADGRTQDERVAAAKALVSYKDRLGTAAIIAAATTQVGAEALTATDNASRETAEAVLAALK